MKEYRGCLGDPPRHELEEGLQGVIGSQRAGEAAEREVTVNGGQAKRAFYLLPVGQNSHMFLFDFSSFFWNMDFSLLVSCASATSHFWGAWQDLHSTIRPTLSSLLGVIS